jgi:raffinose/stachyose/melibiose transport system substrate-binding protein
VKVRTSLALLISLVLVLLAACGGQAATAPTAPAAPATSVATSAVPPTPVPTPTPAVDIVGGGSVKISWWHIGITKEERENWQNLANTYTRSHPEVSIEITTLENEALKAKLATAMESGSPPDIFQSWGGGVLKQYGEAGLVQDLTPALKENGWGDSFQPGPLSLYTLGGKTYGVPWNAAMVGFWYNKALFKQAGIERPPATWSEFLEAIKKLKAAHITPIALGEKDKWPGHYYWVYLATRLGGKDAFEKAYSRQGSFADAPFVQAGAKLKELVALQPFQDGFVGATYSDEQVLMANGKAAMELMGQWAPSLNRSVAQDVDAYNKNLGWFPFPMVEGGAGDPSDGLGGGNGFAIGKNAPPAAVDFVRFLTSLENQTAMAKAGLAVPPVVKGSEAGLSDPLMRELQRHTAGAKYFQLYYDQYLPPAVGQAVNEATQGLFAGVATPEQVVQLIESAAASELHP